MMTQRGVTLIELLVALALLGIVASVATLQLFPARPQARDEVTRLLAEARHRAVLEGRSITITLPADSAGARVATAFPDGRVVTGGNATVDPLTGRIHASP